MATADYVLGIDVGQANDPTALALLEHARAPNPVYRLRALYRFPLAPPTPNSHNQSASGSQTPHSPKEHASRSTPSAWEPL
jgi:hypothetical protein